VTFQTTRCHFNQALLQLVLLSSVHQIYFIISSALVHEISKVQDPFNTMTSRSCCFDTPTLSFSRTQILLQILFTCTHFVHFPRNTQTHADRVCLESLRSLFDFSHSQPRKNMHGLLTNRCYPKCTLYSLWQEPISEPIGIPRRDQGRVPYLMLYFDKGADRRLYQF